MVDRQTLEAQLRGNLHLGPPAKVPELKEWDNLDVGFYNEAEVEGKYGVQKLAELQDMDDDILVDSGIRALQRFGVTDPTSHFGERVVEYGGWMASLEAYLAKGGIRTVGSHQSLVRDFFGTDHNIQTLFPAWIESQIMAGMLATGLVSQLIFATDQVTSSEVKGLVYNDMKREDDTNETLRAVVEGAELPVITLTTEDSTIHLKKYGGVLEVTYEAMAEQKLDVLGFWIRRIGMKLALDETDELLDILIGGDGTTWGRAESNTAVANTDTGDLEAATPGTPAYVDLVDWVMLFNEPYSLRVAVGKGTDLGDLLKLSEFKDGALARAVGDGIMQMPHPLAVTYLRRDPASGATHYKAELMVGVDDRYAARKYTYGGFITEADKLITRQINRRTFSYYVGFRKVDHWATILYDINTIL